MLTLDNIAALTSIAPEDGKSALVLGYVTPGDGGGGLFRFANDSSSTDGATVFAHDADIGTELSDVVAPASINGFALGSDVAWGTVSLELDTTVPLTLTDIHLHGHAVDNGQNAGLAAGQGRLNYSTGIFTDRNSDVNLKTVTAGGSNITVKRKLITNSRRWVRVIDDTDVFHVKWTGAVSGDNDSGHLLCWAINIAARYGYAIVDCDGLDLAQSGIVEIPMNFTLRHGKITTRGNDWAVRLYRTTPLYDFSDPEYIVGQMQPFVCGANSSDASGVQVTLQSMELDGNTGGNQDALLNPGNYSGVEGILQNTPYWSGFSWMDQDGRIMPPNSFCNIYDCHIHNYGSNCLLGYFLTLYTTVNLRLGNSARNHLWYSVNGVHDDLYMYGYAWGTYSKCEGIKATNTTIEELTVNPYFASANILWHYEGDDWGDGSLNEPDRRDHRPGAFWQNTTIKIAEGLLFGSLFGFLGQGLTVDGLTVVTATDGGATIFSEVGNGNQTGLNRNVSIRDVTVYIRCGPDHSVILMSDMFADHVLVESVTFFVRRGFSAPNPATDPQGEYLVLRIPDTTLRVDPAFIFTRTASLREFAYTADYGNGPVRLLDIEDLTTEPVRFVVENGVSRVLFNSLVTAGAGNSGDTSNWTNNNPEKFEGYWRNVFFDINGFASTNMRAFLFTSKEFNNVSIRWTTVVTQTLFSELIINVDQDFTGLTELDIPTDLFWVPKRLGSIDVVPKNALAATTLDGMFLNFRDRGNTQDIEWDDLIAGSPDYRAPILRINVPNPVAAGNVQLEISLRVV